MTAFNVINNEPILPNNSLVLNFQELFGYPSYLTINSWEQGIDWVLYVEGEEPEVRNYLTEAAVPLSFMAVRKEYNKWYKAIPDDIRDELLRYPEMSFTLLYHVNRYSAAYELFIRNPNLVWILLQFARSEKWDEAKVVELLNDKQVNILHACGLPNTRAAVKFIKKLSFDEYSTDQFKRIIEALGLPCYAKFNHNKSLDFPLLSLLVRFPVLLGSSLLNQYDSLNWTYKTESLLRDIGRIAEMLNQVETVNISVRRSKNTNELRVLHDRLAYKLNQEVIEGLAEGNFPEPPILGTDSIIPITGARELALEGKIQHHCVRSYEDPILNNEYYVYRVLTPERATLGLALHKELPPSIDQVLLSWNKPVSKETRNMIESWMSNTYIENFKLSSDF